MTTQSIENVEQPEKETKEIKDTKKVFSISASTADAIDKCGQYFEYNKVQKLQPITRKKMSLDYGGLMHFMLHPYRFGLIKNIKEHHLQHPFHRLLGLEHHNLVRICREIGRIKSMGTNLDVETREKCVEQFAEYVTYYRPRDRFEILEVEQPFSRILYENDEYIILWEGIMDLLVLDPNWGQVPYDTKTGTRDSFRAPTGHQIMGSCWVFDSNKFVIDKVLDQKTEPFRRQVFSFMKESIEEWREDAIKTAFKGITMLEQNYFPRERFACSTYGGCDYVEACKTQPSSREFKLGSFFFKNEKEFDLYTKDHNELEEYLDHVMGPKVRMV